MTSRNASLMAPPPHKQKGFKITFKRMLEFGTTEGCTACEEFSKTLPHNAKCRERFRKILKIDEETFDQPTATAADTEEPANFLEIEDQAEAASASEGEDNTQQEQEVADMGESLISDHDDKENTSRQDFNTSGAIAKLKADTEESFENLQPKSSDVKNIQEKKPSEPPKLGAQIPPQLPSQDLMLGANRE